MNETALEQIKRKVEAQARALQAVVESVARGDFDVEVPVPPEGEGIEALAELASELEMMVDSLQALAAEQEQARADVERGQRQLQLALDDSLAVQRRYLREQWEQHGATGQTGGYYRFLDEEGRTTEAWLPAMTEAVQQQQPVIENEPEATLAVPVQLHGELIGVLGFSRDDAEPWSEEEIATAQVVAAEVAEALDKQRLIDETQQALVETEQMYQASAELAEAQTYDDVLNVLRARTLLGMADHSCSLGLFDRPWVEDREPESIYPIARWGAKDSSGIPNFALRALESDRMQPDQPTIIADTETDPRMDENSRALYVERYGVRSTIAVPLIAGGQWVGYVDALFTGHTEFSEAQVRRLVTLAGQAAIVLQNLRQLGETRERARRERILREITARVRGVSDPDTLAKTAVRELGTALGRPVFIRLGSPDNSPRPPASGAEGDGDGAAADQGADPPRRVNYAQGTPAEGGE